MTIDPTPDETEYPDPYRDCRPIKKDEAIKATEPTDTEIKVWEIIGLYLGDHYSPKRFSNSANIAEDLQADNLDRMEIAMEVEDQFGIEIDDDDEDFETVQDLINLVDSKL